MKRLLLILCIIFVGCDSFYVLQGRVEVGNTSQASIASKTALQSAEALPIRGALLSIYVLEEKNSWNKSILVHSMYSDSAGMFYHYDVIGTGRLNAAVIISKEGFLSDTVYYEYTGADTINVLAKLKIIQ